MLKKQYAFFPQLSHKDIGQKILYRNDYCLRNIEKSFMAFEIA